MSTLSNRQSVSRSFVWERHLRAAEPLSRFQPPPVCQCRGMGISPKAFKELQDRLRGRRRAAPVAVRRDDAASADGSVVLGIDPSLRATGYGVVRVSRTAPAVLAFGTIRCSAAWEHSRCLLQIAESLRRVIREHRPTIGVVEGLFYAQNLRTALVMGEARGAALVAAAEAGLEIYEIAPRKVKLAIVGYGAAQKSAVARMVQRLLGLEKPPESDAADALALALAHAQENRRWPLAALRRV